MIIDIPIIIFNMVFTTVILIQSPFALKDFEVLLKKYTLEFIFKLYFGTSKTNGVLDIEIQNLLLSPRFFLSDDSDKANLEEIWVKLLKTSQNLKQVNRSLSENLRENIQSEEYLNTFTL